VHPDAALSFKDCDVHGLVKELGSYNPAVDRAFSNSCFRLWASLAAISSYKKRAPIQVSPIYLAEEMCRVDIGVQSMVLLFNLRMMDLPLRARDWMAQHSHDDVT